MISEYSLKIFEYDAKRKLLKTSSNNTGRIPSELIIRSHITGVRIHFKPITPDHPWFDQDQWDGEQMIYEPVPEHAHLCRTVETLVIYNS
jgi:hypothetical protein